MRPGQLTPENASEDHGVKRIQVYRFNEAGAINPGKHDAPPLVSPNVQRLQ